MQSGDTAVLVSMNTIIEQDGAQKEINVNGAGTLVTKPNSTYATFTEQLEDIGEVKSIIKMTSDGVTIIRQGPISMRQVYRQGEETEGTYDTPYGNFHTKARTARVDIQERPENSILTQLLLEYDLELQGQRTGHYLVTITIEEDYS